MGKTTETLSGDRGSLSAFRFVNFIPTTARQSDWSEGVGLFTVTVRLRQMFTKQRFAFNMIVRREFTVSYIINMIFEVMR